MQRPGSPIKTFGERSERIGRACDRCNASRTRCGGGSPCYRCQKYGFACRYERAAKKRGPKPRSVRQLFRRATFCPAVAYTHNPFLLHESTAFDDDADVCLPLTNVTTPESGSDSTSANTPPASTRKMCHDMDTFDLCAQFTRTDTDSQAGWAYVSAFDPGRVQFKGSSVVAGEDYASEMTARRYRCLEPLLPLLKDILSSRDACDLLDGFYADKDGTSVVRGSPYILSAVIRQKSLLSAVNPRPVSPALLVVILWCMSHNASLTAFEDPVIRARIIQRLYILLLRLLRARDSHNQPYVPGSRLPDANLLNVTHTDRKRSLSSCGEPAPNVDDVLSFVLLACVSGRESKKECMKWWRKAVLLTKKLGLNSEERIMERTYSNRVSLAAREDHEECRRTFWLVYALDRHLALRFNESLHIHDSDCQVLIPLPEWVWQYFDTIPVEELPHRLYGPPTHILGAGFFESFLPLMVTLGSIINFRLGRSFDKANLATRIKNALTRHEENLDILHLAQKPQATIISAKLPQVPPVLPSLCSDFSNLTNPIFPPEDKMDLVIVYCQCIVHVLHVLLYRTWDATGTWKLKDYGSWTTSLEELACAAHSMAAAESVAQILEMDKDLLFLPFLFGVYLFYGSLSFLTLSDPRVLNSSEREACEVMIRAHEVSLMTFETSFQRGVCQELRSILYSALNQALLDDFDSEALMS